MSPEENTTNAGGNLGDLIGLFAYCSLAAMTRLAKDGDQAPTWDYQVELMRMSATAFREFRHLERFAEENGIDLDEVASQFSGLFDELDQRTRPSNWLERTVKSYVTMGIFADAMRELNRRHQAFPEDDWSGDFGQGAWERETLGELTAKDEQLAARLSLWARRVAGEAFALLRATLFSYPELTGDPDTMDAVVEVATQAHSARLASVNLKA